jgi:hypothetical protein
MRTILIAVALAAPALFAQPDNPKQYNVPRFFSDEVNKILWDGKPLAGRIQIEGRPVQAVEIQEMALAMFCGLAQARGIPQHSITKAMFEGRLNPHWDDLILVFYGLRKYVTVTPDPNNSMVLFDAESQKWNEMFGSLAQIDHVHTIVDGQWQELSALDIGNRLKSRLRGSQSVEKLLSNTAVYTYFDLQNGRDKVSGFHKDYHDLRALSQEAAVAAAEGAGENEVAAARYGSPSSNSAVNLSAGEKLILALTAALIVGAILAPEGSQSAGDKPSPRKCFYECPLGTVGALSNSPHSCLLIQGLTTMSPGLNSRSAVQHCN